jgi:hypothetical protein
VKLWQQQQQQQQQYTWPIGTVVSVSTMLPAEITASLSITAPLWTTTSGEETDTHTVEKTKPNQL